jgi:hypothetical protein
MRIFSRKNAFIGWLTVMASKRMLKRKVRQAVVPAVDPVTRRPNTSALALLAASVVGLATFWRSRSSDDSAGQD